MAITLSNLKLFEGSRVIYAKFTISGGTASDKGICYSITNDNPTVTTDNICNNFWNDTYMYSNIYYVNNLSPSTCYYIRGYVKDSKNNYYYTNAIKTYTTPPGKGISCTGYPSESWANTAQAKIVTERTLTYLNNSAYVPAVTFYVTYDYTKSTAAMSTSGELLCNDARYINTGTWLHEIGHLMDYTFGDALSNQDFPYARYGHILGRRLAEMCEFLFDTTNSGTICNDIHCFPFTEYTSSYSIETHTFQDQLHQIAALFNCVKGYDGFTGVSNKKLITSYYIIDEDYNYYIKAAFSNKYLTDVSGVLMYTNTAIEASKWRIIYDPYFATYKIQNTKTSSYINIQTSSVALSTSAPTSYGNIQISPSIYNGPNNELTCVMIRFYTAGANDSISLSTTYLNIDGRPCIIGNTAALNDNTINNVKVQIDAGGFNPRLNKYSFIFEKIQ